MSKSINFNPKNKHGESNTALLCTADTPVAPSFAGAVTRLAGSRPSSTQRDFAAIEAENTSLPQAHAATSPRFPEQRAHRMVRLLPRTMKQATGQTGRHSTTCPEPQPRLLFLSKQAPRRRAVSLAPVSLLLLGAKTMRSWWRLLFLGSILRC